MFALCFGRAEHAPRWRALLQDIGGGDLALRSTSYRSETFGPGLNVLWFVCAAGLASPDPVPNPHEAASL